MSKLNDLDSIDKVIMSQIRTGKIKMKPKIYYILGTTALVLGLIGAIVTAVFFTSVTSFALRQHGPMGQYRLEQMLESFPWWSPILALLGISIGILILRRFDVSYKKNFLLIVIAVLGATLLAGWFIDYSGLDEIWLKRGPMQQFYHQYLNGQGGRGPGWGMSRFN